MNPRECDEAAKLLKEWFPSIVFNEKGTVEERDRLIAAIRAWTSGLE